MDRVVIAMEIMNKNIRPAMSPSTPATIQGAFRDFALITKNYIAQKLYCAKLHAQKLYCAKLHAQKLRCAKIAFLCDETNLFFSFSFFSFAELIESCWDKDPLERPTFPTIVAKLRTLCMQFPLQNFNAAGASRMDAPTGHIFLVQSV